MSWPSEPSGPHVITGENDGEKIDWGLPGVLSQQGGQTEEERETRPQARVRQGRELSYATSLGASLASNCVFMA